MSIVLENAMNDKNYRPYCMRCRTMERMSISEPFLWKCRHCGAIHDERLEAKQLKNKENQP